jgi:hypothetical protein
VARRCRPWWAVAVAILSSSPSWAQTALPDPARTPGALNPTVTQDNVFSTICVRGWTRTVRPPWQYTSRLKRDQLRDWGYVDQQMADYEEDHLVPLGVGGAPYDERNLWPEPRASADGWNADLKDRLEAVLNHLVCAGRLPLAEAQHAIATNWIEAWRRFVGAE